MVNTTKRANFGGARTQCNLLPLASSCGGANGRQIRQRPLPQVEPRLGALEVPFKCLALSDNLSRDVDEPPLHA